LRELQGEGLLTDVRGEGAVWAVTVPDGMDAAAVRNRMLTSGVIVRPIGNHLAMCPPLVITDEQVDRIVEAMGSALRTG
jgi:diaminobutyrate-2-oxoglutarate transaminase